MTRDDIARVAAILAAAYELSDAHGEHHTQTNYRSIARSVYRRDPTKMAERENAYRHALRRLRRAERALLEACREEE